jgi:hypothetical protein
MDTMCFLAFRTLRQFREIPRGKIGNLQRKACIFVHVINSRSIDRSTGFEPSLKKRYGSPQTAATSDKGRSGNNGTVEATAGMPTAAAAGRNLLSFAGYSVTVGRGSNHLEQSFRSLRILEPILQHSELV